MTLDFLRDLYKDVDPDNQAGQPVMKVLMTPSENLFYSYMYESADLLLQIAEMVKTHNSTAEIRKVVEKLEGM